MCPLCFKFVSTYRHREVSRHWWERLYIKWCSHWYQAMFQEIMQRGFATIKTSCLKSVTMLFPIVLARVSGVRVMAAKCQLCTYGINISCAEKLSSNNKKESPTDSSATFSKCSSGVKYLERDQWSPQHKHTGTRSTPKALWASSPKGQWIIVAGWGRRAGIMSNVRDHLTQQTWVNHEN